MASLDDYRAFAAVVEQGNLSAAAKHLHRSLQSISRALQGLESELGVELIQRTTRRSRPTQAGVTFHARIRKALEAIDLARSSVTAHGGRVDGVVRVAGSTQFAPPHLVPALAAFMERYPDVQVELVVADHYANLQRERIDVAVRLGELPDSRLGARQLGEAPQVTVGAPDYFAQFGRPRTPRDLRKHRCIVRGNAGMGRRWVYRRAQRTQQVEVDGPFRADNAAACNQAAVAGLGITVAALWQVQRLIDQGRLQTVLDEWRAPSLPIHLVWPSTRQLPARTRALIDFLAVRWAGAALESSA